MIPSPRCPECCRLVTCIPKEDNEQKSGIPDQKYRKIGILDQKNGWEMSSSMGGGSFFHLLPPSSTFFHLLPPPSTSSHLRFCEIKGPVLLEFVKLKIYYIQHCAKSPQGYGSLLQIRMCTLWYSTPSLALFLVTSYRLVWAFFSGVPHPLLSFVKSYDKLIVK
jgi:hypothetical protein